MPGDDYLNLYLDAGTSDRRDQEMYGCCLDAVLARNVSARAKYSGWARRAPAPTLISTSFTAKPSRTCLRGVFNKRNEARRVCPIASIARLRETQEGFKGSELTITANDARGKEVFKIVWGLGGPDWVVPLVQRHGG